MLTFLGAVGDVYPLPPQAKGTRARRTSGATSKSFFNDMELLSFRSEPFVPR
ncbi:MAG TPA: hypothetical protein VF376_05765 [Thermoanaerobaculia bacterium]